MIKRLDITPTNSSRSIIASGRNSLPLHTETHISSFDIAKEEFQPIKTKLDLFLKWLKNLKIK